MDVSGYSSIVLVFHPFFFFFGFTLLNQYFVHVAEQCEKDKARVLVHCMSGKNR